MHQSKSTLESRQNTPAAHQDKPASSQLAPVFIQTKLTVGAPDDIYEKEADAVAERVMRMPEREAVSSPIGAGPAGIQRKCTHCKEEEKQRIQTKPLAAQITPFVQRKGDGDSTASEALSNQINASRGSGSPLPDHTRSFMESRIGADFSGVRVHTDGEAVQMNRELNAQAFTVGRDVYFGAGNYSPDSSAGKSLLAHELTHVVQQGAGRSSIQMQRASQRVSLQSSGNCQDPRAIARAILGALAMTNTAIRWFQSFNPRDRARVDGLLNQIFLSNATNVRDHVDIKIYLIDSYLQRAKDGNVLFHCADATEAECTDRMGFVRRTVQNTINVCPAFFLATDEERKWNLIHECSHLAGVSTPRESYSANFGTVNCQGSISGSVTEALRTADNYSRFIWCLTRPASTLLNNP